MKRFGRTIILKPEHVEEYVAYHADVFPEIEAALRASGVRQMHIFLRGTRLFMFAVTEDDFSWTAYMERATADRRGREWEDLMKSFQEPAPEADPAEWWAAMDEVFAFEA